FGATIVFMPGAVNEVNSTSNPESGIGSSVGDSAVDQSNSTLTPEGDGKVARKGLTREEQIALGVGLAIPVQKGNVFGHTKEQRCPS
ncbi:MAG: hypothetical protein Q9179_007112, partial [Wetmoreana sp. 5 TL-2023]